MKTYGINEVFYSLQGEGVRAGTPNIFVRFQGCNQRCAVGTHGFDCDTEFMSGRKVALDDLVAEANSIGNGCDAVIFTGGEPGLQLDAAVVRAFKAHGYYTAIETNGSIDVSGLGLDWVCVSPKFAEHTLKQITAHEVKYVRSVGQGIPRSAVTAQNYLISPAFTPDGLSRETLEWCIRLCKENPPWRLSLQLHKLVYRVR